jgi:tRNA (guanine37-N1)-methyltransferase
MKIEIVTLFPAMCKPFLNDSIMKRAQEGNYAGINIHNLRDYSRNKHRKVDDRPYGGGPGMLIKPEPLFAAIEDLSGMKYNGSSLKFKSGLKKKGIAIVFMTPQGRRLNQSLARRLAKFRKIIIICGHYEGIDERVRRGLIMYEVSIGDYVLTGGELPAMVLVDSVVRLIPGVVGHTRATALDSFSVNRLEYPQYTRPAKYRRMKVPEILLSGRHREILKWRQEQSLKRTSKRRPDLLNNK